MWTYTLLPQILNMSLTAGIVIVLVLLSPATGRRLINGSPLAFGEGDIKGRIKNVMNFKKPDPWVTAVSIVLVAALSVGFAANKASSNDIANSTQAPEVTTTQVVLYNYSGNAAKPLGESLLRYEPESEYRIPDIVAMQIFYPEGTVKLSLYCQSITGNPILLRSVDFTVENSNERKKPDIRNPDIFVWKVAIDFPYGFSGTIWAEAIDSDGKKFPSDVCKANSIL